MSRMSITSSLLSRACVFVVVVEEKGGAEEQPSETYKACCQFGRRFVGTRTFCLIASLIQG